MKSKIVMVCVAALLLLASCSNKRFGHVPKAKRAPAKKESFVPKKNRKPIVQLTAKPVAVSAKHLVTGTVFIFPTVYSPAKKNYKSAEATPTTMLRPLLPATVHNTEKTSYPKKTVNIIPAPAAGKGQNSWGDFWYEVEETLLEIGFYVGLLLLAIGLSWLAANGLAWLALIIIAALLVLLIIAIADMLSGISDFFEGFFRRRN